MNDDDPPITGSQVVVGESEAVKEVYKQLCGSAVGWRPSKETEKVVKKLAKKLGITERAVIDEAILEMWSGHQPRNPFAPGAKKNQKKRLSRRRDTERVQEAKDAG